MFFSGLVTRCPPMKRFVKGHILAVVCVLFVIMEAPRTRILNAGTSSDFDPPDPGEHALL